MQSTEIKAIADDELIEVVTCLAKAAKQAAPAVARLSRNDKDGLLLDLAYQLEAEAESIMAANALDVIQAKKDGQPSAFVERLTITSQTIASMADGLRQVAELPDPVGEMENSSIRPNGMRVGKMRIPLGVIGFIYESRPNVTIDAAGLCLKSGNAIILKGGSEALRSNLALAELIGQTLIKRDLPQAAVQVVPLTDRRAVTELLKLDDYIDLVIPRGGEGLIRLVAQQARMPVLKHYKGVCHLYVDNKADANMAVDLAVNGKVQRPGTCNALETLLVHRDIAFSFLPQASAALLKHGVMIKGCGRTAALVPQANRATEDDWATEYLDLTISVKIVDDMDEAMAHIARYGSRHTEVICTNDYSRSMEFINRVDASAVMINASSRLNDGGQLGLGAEIGISTDKLHAYGPMGLRELTTTKFVIFGQGQIRE